MESTDPVIHSRKEEGGHEGWTLIALFILALLVRLPLLFDPEVIHCDGIEYIRHAFSIRNGDWSGSKAHPLYPTLIALLTSFLPDSETAGILISVIFGSGLIFPVYFLGKELFHPRVGKYAALLATAHPTLIAYSGSVLTESLYFFLFSFSLLLAWKTFKKERWFDVVRLGIFMALAYLARPEAIGLLFLFWGWVLWVNPPDGKRGWTKRFGIFLTLLATFFVFSFPYLLHIHRETGKWQLSKKAALAIGSLTEEEGAPLFGRPRGKKALTLSSLLKHPLPVLTRLGTGLLDSFYKFFIVLNPLLFLLAVIGGGFLIGRDPPFSSKGHLYLLSHILFYFGLIFPLFFISKRFAAQMIGITLPWAAYGYLRVTEGIPDSWRKRLPSNFQGWVFILILIGLLIQGRLFYNRDHRMIHKEAGLWMKANLPQEAVLMSRLPQEAFYAGMAWVPMGVGNYEKVSEEARSKGVRFLITDHEVAAGDPGFMEHVERRGELRLVHEWRRGGRHLILWEFLR